MSEITHEQIIERVAVLETKVDHLTQTVGEERVSSQAHRQLTQKRLAEMHDYLTKERANKALVNKAARIIAGVVATAVGVVAIAKGLK